LSLFHWCYLNCYLILSYFQNLDGSFSLHNPQEHWTSANRSDCTKRCVTPVGAATPLSSVRSSQGGSLWDHGHGTYGRSHSASSGKSSTATIGQRPWQWEWRPWQWRWSRGRRSRQRGWRRRWWGLQSFEWLWEGEDVPRGWWDKDRQKLSSNPHLQIAGFNEPCQHHHSFLVRNQESSAPRVGRVQRNRGELQQA
jgi:hypothetical protein